VTLTLSDGLDGVAILCTDPGGKVGGDYRTSTLDEGECHRRGLTGGDFGVVSNDGTVENSSLSGALLSPLSLRASGGMNTDEPDKEETVDAEGSPLDASGENNDEGVARSLSDSIDGGRSTTGVMENAGSWILETMDGVWGNRLAMSCEWTEPLGRKNDVSNDTSTPSCNAKDRKDGEGCSCDDS
jgi:hypothetical protein